MRNELGEARWRSISGWRSEVCSGDLIVSAWSTDDVIAQAEEDGFLITREQAREVLTQLEQNFDAQVGINWTTISSVIQEVLETT